jgi:DNA-binding NtrC family response regulator
MLLVEGDELRDADFPLTTGAAPRLSEGVELPAHGIDLERSGWNQTRAATLLGLNRDQIRYRIEKFKLERAATAK